jgi:hypothetical protein
VFGCGVLIVVRMKYVQCFNFSSRLVRTKVAVTAREQMLNLLTSHTASRRFRTV